LKALLETARLAALDASIARGVADSDAGRVKPTSDVFDNLEAKLKARAKAEPAGHIRSET
jgi:antitoxin ParD1/3/4